MTTGDTIREIRIRKGLTQIELAQAAGIAVNSLRLYEQGKRYPKQAALQRISDALGVSDFSFLRKERDKLHRIIDQTIVRLNDETARADALQRRCDDLEKSRQAWVQKAMALGRHGHWIEYGDVQVCSECGAEHGWDEYRASFCEDCGAKMDEVRK